MSFEYSSFISYRRNEGDKKFLKQFKKIIDSEAKRVTDIEESYDAELYHLERLPSSYI